MIFVTGGTGLVGTHLLFSLTRSGRTVRALKRPGSDLSKVSQTFGYYTSEAAPLLRRIEWVEGDILDPVSLRRAMEGISLVYHTAAAVSFNERNQDAIIQANAEGTRNMVNACLDEQVKRLCHVSSIAVFETSESGIPVREDAPRSGQQSHSVYARSKQMAEEYVLSAVSRGLSAVVVNPAIILGPGQWGRGSSRFFTTVDGGLPVCTPGGNSFVDVRDVVQAMLLLTEGDSDNQQNHKKTGNLCQYILSGHTCSFQELLCSIAHNLGRSGPRVVLPLWTGDAAQKFVRFSRHLWPGLIKLSEGTLRSAYHQATYDGNLICRETGFTYTPFAQTLSDICQLYLKYKKNAI